MKSCCFASACKIFWWQIATSACEMTFIFECCYDLWPGIYYWVGSYIFRTTRSLANARLIFAYNCYIHITLHPTIWSLPQAITQISTCTAKEIVEILDQHSGDVADGYELYSQFRAAVQGMRGVSGFATDCPCNVWCRGLTTCLLHVSPPFGNRFLTPVGL